MRFEDIIGIGIVTFGTVTLATLTALIVLAILHDRERARDARGRDDQGDQLGPAFEFDGGWRR